MFKDNKFSPQAPLEMKKSAVLQEKTATPSLSSQNITPDTGNDGLSKVTVNPITKELLATLDSDFVAGNIKKDVDMFGLVGTLAGGALPEGLTAIDYKVITLDHDITNSEEKVTIEHNLGVAPSAIIVWMRGQLSSSWTNYTIKFGVYSKTRQLWNMNVYGWENFITYKDTSGTNMNRNFAVSGYIANVTESSFDLSCSLSGSNIPYWRTGTLYALILKFSTD